MIFYEFPPSEVDECVEVGVMSCPINPFIYIKNVPFSFIIAHFAWLRMEAITKKSPVNTMTASTSVLQHLAGIKRNLNQLIHCVLNVIITRI